MNNASAPSRPILPYGEWPSPLAIADVVAGGTRFGALLPAGESLWWTEGRPAEQGRQALCRLPLGGLAGQEVVTVLPPPWNVSNRVHEYGGGTLATDGLRLWLCHDGDSGIHELPLGGDRPQLLIAQPGLRFADLVACPTRGSLLAVCEDHRGAGEARNFLAEIPVEGPERGQLRVLAQGHDFYSNPCPSPDGRHLAWLAWDHPCMPWDGTTLWCASWIGQGLGPALALAGSSVESLFQPAWSPAGELHVVSDRSDWGNLYRIRAADLEDAMAHAVQPPLQALCPLAAEFAQPQWEFGMRSYGFLASGAILAIARSEGRAQLGTIPADGGAFVPLPLEWEDFRALQVRHDRAWCFAGAPTAGETVIEIDLAQGSARALLDLPPALAPEAISRARSIRFPGSGGRSTHAFYYAPQHPTVQGPPEARPPLIVINHGGPTSATSSTLRLAVQFWTTRGFAVLDVNYGGSTGFGREYRCRLDGQWGVVDVEDALAGVRWLAAQDWIDPQRAAIRGSSAGGFTTLAALAFHRVFRAGVSLYGIGDLSLLASDTHKFESRYLDRLVAPWPEGAAIYQARSPLAHVEGMEAALLLLQGAEDRVVPPNQAEAMYAAVRAKGLPVACLIFPGEQHGFRRAETVAQALAAELGFYGRIFGFTPADALDPLEIANLAP